MKNCEKTIKDENFLDMYQSVLFVETNYLWRVISYFNPYEPFKIVIYLLKMVKEILYWTVFLGFNRCSSLKAYLHVVPFFMNWGCSTIMVVPSPHERKQWPIICFLLERKWNGGGSRVCHVREDFMEWYNRGSCYVAIKWKVYNIVWFL